MFLNAHIVNVFDSLGIIIVQYHPEEVSSLVSHQVLEGDRAYLAFSFSEYFTNPNIIHYPGDRTFYSMLRDTISLK